MKAAANWFDGAFTRRDGANIRRPRPRDETSKCAINERETERGEKAKRAELSARLLPFPCRPVESSVKRVETMSQRTICWSQLGGMGAPSAISKPGESSRSTDSWGFVRMDQRQVKQTTPPHPGLSQAPLSSVLRSPWAPSAPCTDGCCSHFREPAISPAGPTVHHTDQLSHPITAMAHCESPRNDTGDKPTVPAGLTRDRSYCIILRSHLMLCEVSGEVVCMYVCICTSTCTWPR